MSKNSSIMNRMFVVFGVIMLLPVAVTLQLLRINFLVGEELRELWSNQTIATIPIPARRGNIYDADGSLLATNSVSYKVAIDPYIPELTDQKMRKTCSILAQYSSRSTSFYLDKIYSSSEGDRYVVLKEEVSVEVYDALKALDYRAVILEQKYERVYPFGKLAAHVLGFVNYNMDGMMGLEKEYNKVLQGNDGAQRVRLSRSGEIYAYLGAPKKEPEQGYSLYTTINSKIQAILEEELKAGVIDSKSNWGTAIVMNPQTGAVLAMANYPTFNPNHPAAVPKGYRRNHMISSVVEPGSTFKLVTAIAALERNKVQLHEKIKTSGGELLIHGQWMRDHEAMGTLTFPEVIQKSSNIGVSKIAMRLDKDVFYQYVRNLGFGTRTGIDLPDEQNGFLKKPYKWSAVTQPWMSIGYEILVTPIQMAQAYAAFANSGVMMQPYIVEKIVNESGDLVWQHEPVRVRRIAEKETVKKLKPVFAGVVSDSGTAPLAKVQGLAIAGKTGTAQKVINGEYRHEYRSSFIGFFPIDDPQYLIYVLLDGPQVYPFYGGWTAAPIFQQVAKRIAGMDNDIEENVIHKSDKNKVWAYMPGVRGLTYKKAKALLENQNIDFEIRGSGKWIIDQIPDSGSKLTQKSNVILVRADLKKEDKDQDKKNSFAIVPELVGLSMRQAVYQLREKGFKAKVIGSGTVNKQFPDPGMQFKKGRTVLIRGDASFEAKLTE